MRGVRSCDANWVGNARCRSTAETQLRCAKCWMWQPSFVCIR